MKSDTSSTMYTYYYYTSFFTLCQEGEHRLRHDFRRQGGEFWMKQSLGFYFFTAAAMLLLPAASLMPQDTLSFSGDTDLLRRSFFSPQPDSSDDGESDAAASAPESEAAAESYRVLDISTGEVLEVPLKTYLIGAVCAEMPATFEPEALKAQAVAVHTYAERIRRRNQHSPDPSLLGADFSNDAGKYQAYYTESQLRTAYGDAYETCYAKAAAAVEAVASELIYHEGEPIIAAFHAISGGKTESSEAIWGEPLSYLVSVDSAADTAAPRYQETVSFSPDDIKASVHKVFPDVQFADDAAAWCKVLTVSDAGTVLTMQCGNTVCSGQQVREMLGLRSACFTIEFSDGVFRFTTKGYGHTVGMSQYGANEMAKNGASYKEILAHYYPDTTLSAVSVS